MICFVDLPNLRSIDSRECSFYHPRVVTLESITIHCIRIAFRYSKSPIYRSTWFIPGSSIEINFECCVDWFDFIHRCFFHSLWFSQYQAVSPSLDLHILYYSILFNDYCMFNVYTLCLFQISTYHWTSAVLNLSSMWYRLVATLEYRFGMQFTMQFYA